MRVICSMLPVLLYVASCSKTPSAAPSAPDLAAPLSGNWVESLARNEMDDSVQAMVTVLADNELALYDGTKPRPNSRLAATGPTSR